jgi:predicted PurR-regulated permease PerM
MRHNGFLNSPEVFTLVRAGLWLAGVAAGIWFLTKIQLTLTIFGLAWLIAYLTKPIVARMEGRRLGPIEHCSRGLAVATMYLVLCAVLALLGSMAFPAISAQFEGLLSLHPEDLAANVQTRAEALIQKVPEQYRAQLLERLQASAGTISSTVARGVSEGLRLVGNFLTEFAAGAAIFISALLISIYLLLSWESLYLTAIGAVPPKYRGDFETLLARMNQIFGGYLRATIVTSVVCGALTLVALWLYALLAGRPVPYAYVVALIACITYPVPLFGILVASVAALVLGFIPDNDVGTGVMVAVVTFVVNLIIDRTIQPKLMGDAIGVSPMFVIFAAAAGGEFMGGVWGMLFGIPLAAMTKAFLTWFHDLFMVDHKHAPAELPPSPGQIPPAAAIPLEPAPSPAPAVAAEPVLPAVKPDAPAVPLQPAPTSPPAADAVPPPND